MFQCTTELGGEKKATLLIFGKSSQSALHAFQMRCAVRDNESNTSNQRLKVSHLIKRSRVPSYTTFKRV